MNNISNHACFIGTLEADPVIGKEQDGGSVAEFTLACRDNFLKRDGSESVQFLPMSLAVAADDEDALTAAKALRKGMLVGVNAQLIGRTWTDEDGFDRRELKIAAIDVEPIAGL